MAVMNLPLGIKSLKDVLLVRQRTNLQAGECDGRVPPVWVSGVL
jgi:hypothetical protein